MSKHHPKLGIVPICLGALTMFVCSTGLSFAQSSPEEIRKMLGHPVDIENSVVFTASRSSLKELCNEEPEFEGHASVIGRLEYGSFDASDQDSYKRMLASQVQSNRSIFGMLDEDGRREFCQGLRSTILGYSADFVEAHPTLFTETEPEPRPKEKPYLEQIADQLDGQEEAYQLYIVRITENRIGDDMKKVFAHPDNAGGSGLTWALKVIATEYRLLSMITENRFPDISAIYGERSDLYARTVRGELEIDEMVIEEKQNEKKKNDLYNARFEVFKDALNDRPADVAKPLNEIAEKISTRLIAQAKYVASEGGKAN